MTNPYQLTFTLKQHTPIIHFQHDQEGATLRASEVKPKLDKFIIEELPLVAPEIVKKFERGYNELKNARDNKSNSGYRMNVVSNQHTNRFYLFLPEKKLRAVEDSDKRAICETLNIEDPKLLTIVGDSPFFANSDKLKQDKETKKFKVSSDIRIAMFNQSPISVYFVFNSTRSGLHELVKYSFPKLLACENFGTRQSKGFGSFGIVGCNINSFMEDFKLKHTPCYDWGNFVKWEEALKEVNRLWKRVKNDSASKESLIRDYYLKKGIEWEKKIVREKLILNNNSIDEKLPDEFKYVRALLGLAELMDYPFDNKQKIKISDSHEQISRFRSPVQFKYFENSLFIGVSKIPSEMLNREFVFFKGSNAKNSKQKIKIKTPSDINIENILDMLF